VTHDQEEALELADRVAILNAGKLEQVGSPDDVYDRPASAFVMAFVGDTSSIPVELDSGKLTFCGQPFAAEFAGPLRGRGRLYVRPKDIVIAEPQAERLSGTVINVHRTAAGRRAQIVLSVSAAAADIVLEAEIGLEQKLSAGERVGLQFRQARVFSEQS